jgi:hypothetical protein
MTPDNTTHYVIMDVPKGRRVEEARLLSEKLAGAHNLDVYWLFNEVWHVTYPDGMSRALPAMNPIPLPPQELARVR